MHRPRKDGGNDVISVVVAEKEVPHGTLDGILATGNVSLVEFLKALRRKH